MIRLAPSSPPPHTLDAMASATVPELFARAGTLLSLRIPSTEKRTLLGDNLERTYRDGVRDGWRALWLSLYPKGS